MIDLRSDTLTRPTTAMRAAMTGAEVGDDVFGEDPTVRRLEERTAELLGKEAALFVASGTMGNQLGVRVHCRPGDEFLCDFNCHVFQYEQGAYAQLFGVAARPLPTPDGLLTPELCEEFVRPENVHYPRLKLLCLENTHNRMAGRVLRFDDTAAACQWAAQQGLARHLDGARLMNAVVAGGVTAARWGSCFDTVSVCFSKGLGAPVGSALCGPADLIAEARRVRKALGGGWRQAGLLAAAALYALDHHVERLADDHANAKFIADAVRSCARLALDPDYGGTNIVIIRVDESLGTAAEFAARLAERGVRVGVSSKHKIRAVTHLDCTAGEAQRAAEAILEAGR